MNKKEIINKLKKLMGKIDFNIITNTKNNEITIFINDYVNINDIIFSLEKIDSFIKDNNINEKNYNEYYEILNILNYDSYNEKNYEELFYLNIFIDQIKIIINNKEL